MSVPDFSVNPTVGGATCTSNVYFLRLAWNNAQPLVCNMYTYMYEVRMLLYHFEPSHLNYLSSSVGKNITEKACVLELFIICTCLYIMHSVATCLLYHYFQEFKMLYELLVSIYLSGNPVRCVRKCDQ